MGGFPQPQFAQQRSIFDAQHAQPQSPYAQSPWGVQMPPQQMPHLMQQPSFPSSPFGQMPQQPFGQFPTQPMAQPWQDAQFAQNMGSPAPMNSQPIQQYMAQGAQMGQPSMNSAPQAFSPSPVPAQLNVGLVKSPAQANAVPQESAQAIEEEQKPVAWSEPTPVAEPTSKKEEAKAEQVRLPQPPPGPVAAAAPASTPKVIAKEPKKESKPVEVAPEPVAEPESRASTPPAAAPSVAPWAAEDKAKPAKSMSLKEIQEAEARVAEKKKSAEAKAKAALAASQPIAAESSEALQQMSFGLASRPALNTASSTASNTSAPVWGAAPAVGSKKQMPKRTLQQIQEEERAKKVS